MPESRRPAALAALPLLTAMAACSSRTPAAPPDDGGHRDAAASTPDGSRRDAARVDGRRPTFDAHDARGRADAPADAGAPVDAATDAPADAGPPFDAPGSTTLSLSLPLVPAFSPAIHDYYVRCATGDNAITVTMTSAPGSLIGLVQPITTPPEVASTVTVSVPEGAVIVAAVTSSAMDGGSDEYWVRCLPSDFATLHMDLHAEAGTVTPGYYLVGDLSTNSPPIDAGYAMALDTNGVPVWYTRSVSGIEPIDVESLSPGTISFDNWPAPTLSTVAVGQFEIHDLVVGTTSFVATVGAPLDLHELRELPNGNYLMLADPVLTGVDLTGLRSFGANMDLEACVVQEVDPSTGDAVWQWDAIDDLDPVQDCTSPSTKTIGGTLVVEAFHCNSIDVAPNGDLLVSVRNMDSVVMIEKRTHKMLWKLGGSSFTKTGAPYITVTGDPRTSFYGQHDARLQGDGSISMYDDHTGHPGPSRAVIYALDLTGNVATVVWQHAGSANAIAMGSFRILPDGSRTIGWGEGAPGLAFTEVDEAGDDLLDFHFVDHRWTYRAIKVPLASFDITTLRAATGP